MNPDLYRGKQVEPSRAALGARVGLDPSPMPAGSSKIGLGNGRVEDVERADPHLHLPCGVRYKGAPPALGVRSQPLSGDAKLEVLNVELAAPTGPDPSRFPARDPAPAGGGVKALRREPVRVH
jgi:hypothetical protein